MNVTCGILPKYTKTIGQLWSRSQIVNHCISMKLVYKDLAHSTTEVSKSHGVHTTNHQVKYIYQKNTNSKSNLTLISHAVPSSHTIFYGTFNEFNLRVHSLSIVLSGNALHHKLITNKHVD